MSEAIGKWLRGRTGVLGINRRNLDFVFADYRPGRFRILDDKVRTKEALERAGVAVPVTLDVLRRGSDLPRLERLLSDRDELVLKPGRGWGGRGILVLERRNGRWTGPDGKVLERGAVAAHVRDILSGAFSLDEEEDVAIAEERIRPDPFFTAISPDGLADLRIVTRHGEPIQAMCRLPTRRSGGKANLHGGGVGAGLDLATGALSGGVCAGRPVSHHPDTGVALDGLRVPGWADCLELARRASRAVGFDYAGVDLVIDRGRGPLVLEVNARPGLAIQIANGRGQPVAAFTPSAFDRLTLGAAFALFGLLMVAPPVLDAWESGRRTEPRTEAVGAVPVAAESVAKPASPAARAFGREWDDEDVPASSLSESFQAARAAAAEGDTAQALALYRDAAREKSVATFALNNMALIRRRSGNPEGALALLDEALDLYPTYSRGWYNRGLVLRDLDRDDEALDAFRKALEIRPGHALSWAALGELRFDRREFGEAALAFEQAVRFDPASSSYRTRMGLALRLTDDYRGAAECFHDALRLDPGNEVDTYWWVRSVLDGRAAGTIGDDPAAADLEAALVPHVEADPPSWRCVGLLGILRRDAGRAAEALPLLERARHEHDPDDSITRAAGAAAVDLGLWDRAGRRLARVDAEDDDLVALREWCSIGRFLDLPLRDARMDPDAVAALRESFRAEQREALRRALLDGDADAAESAVAEAHGVPGPLARWIAYRAAEDRGDGETAAAALAALRDAVPDFYPLLRLDFRRARDEGRGADARKIGQRMLSLDSRDDDLRIDLAALELGAGREARARALLNRLPEARRALPDARIVDAALMRVEGDPRGSAAILKELLRTSPESVDARVELARALSESGHERSAVVELRAAVDLAPDRTAIRELLARALMDRKRYDEAAAEWRRVVQLDPAPSHRFNHGLSLQRAGQEEEAVAEYDAVIKEEPDNYRAWFNRALAFERLGRLEDAKSGFRKVLDLEPEHEPSRTKLADMEGESK